MRAVVCLVTYNERDNIAWMIEHILGQAPCLDVLVVDDNSPDGTGEVVETLAARPTSAGRVSIVHRPGKAGYGSAVLLALETALKRGYDPILTMDADRSHDPRRLRRMLRALEGCDVVIGSRYVPGGGTKNWPVSRLVQSRLANLYVRIALGLSAADASGGFRGYRADLLRRARLDRIANVGYIVLEEILFHCVRAGARVMEVPIVFVDRAAGVSKLSRWEVLRGLWAVLKLRWRFGTARGSAV
jgi:glycosyltransferase involved in cell wall biosynthesis